MADFLLFEAPVNGGISISRPATPDKISEALALRDVCAISRELAFSFASVRREGIRSLAGRLEANSIAGLSSLLSGISPGKLERELLALCDEVAKKSKYGEEERLKPVQFAWSCYFNEVLKKIFPLPDAVRKLSFSKRPSKGSVRFAADIDGWQIVKKTDFGKASQGEALACLAGISAAANKKSVEWLFGSNFASLEALLANAVKNSRKSFSKIPAALANFSEVEKELSRTCKPEHLKIASEYYVRAVFAGFGYPAEITPAQVGEIWPEFKAPAMRGRKLKG